MSLLAKIALGCLGALVVIFISSENWRTAGRSLLFVMIFEGVFRKWLLPSAADFIYFAKDWVLVGTVIGMYAKGNLGRPVNWQGLPLWIGLIAALTGLEIFNPVMDSPIAGIMGLKGWVLWSSLVFVVPRLFDRTEEFVAYLGQHLWVFFAVAALAVVQFRLPESHILNQYVRPQDAVAAFGEQSFVRVCATFSYLTGFTNYLAFVPVLFFPAAMYLQGRTGNLVQYVAVPLVFGVSSMTGARVMLYYLAAFVPAFLVVAAATGAVRVMRLVRICLVAGVFTAGLVFSNTLFRSAFEALMQRQTMLTGGDDTAIGRGLGGFGAAFEPQLFSIVGEGVGSTTEAPRKIADLVGAPANPSARYSETEPGRVMIETGVVGLVLWTSFKIYVILIALMNFRQRREGLARAVVLGVIFYHVFAFASQPTFDHSMAPFYWFSIGLLFLMEKLDQPRPVAPPMQWSQRRGPAPLKAVRKTRHA